MTAIRLPQARVLAVLAKSGPLSRKAICEKTKVTIGPINNALGESDDKCRNAGDKRRGYPSLLNLKFVRFVLGEEGGEPATLLAITSPGKKALESALKELGGKIPPVQEREHKPYKNAKAAESNGKSPDAPTAAVGKAKGKPAAKPKASAKAKEEA